MWKGYGVDGSIFEGLLRVERNAARDTPVVSFLTVDSLLPATASCSNVTTRTIRAVLEKAVATARDVSGGQPATYIPELACAPLEHVSVAVTDVDGHTLVAGDNPEHRFTLQSSAKLVVLLGLLEERGHDAVFEVVGSEPSGSSFASIARLDDHGPQPSNPFVNSGAIALCGQLSGTSEDRQDWLMGWAERLYGRRLTADHKVLDSERRSGNRNRSIGYLLKSNGVFEGEVDDILETYFYMCSFSATIAEASRLPALLANLGRAPDGRQVFSEATALCVQSLMATSGMYDESGAYFRRTGLPAKSGVSGVIVAVAPGRAGIAVFSPRVGPKGGSIRGHHMLREMRRELGWHFAKVAFTPTV